MLHLTGLLNLPPSTSQTAPIEIVLDSSSDRPAPRDFCVLPENHEIVQIRKQDEQAKTKEEAGMGSFIHHKRTNHRTTIDRCAAKEPHEIGVDLRTVMQWCSGGTCQAVGAKKIRWSAVSLLIFVFADASAVSILIGFLKFGSEAHLICPTLDWKGSHGANLWLH